LRERNLSQHGLFAQVDLRLRCRGKRDSVGAMESMFWMGGRLATGLELVTDDLEALRSPGFWAVVGSFESKWILAKFSQVSEETNLLQIKQNMSWNAIPKDLWQSKLSQHGYVEYVEKIRERIAEGEVYQVNACRVLSAENRKNASLVGLAKKIHLANPAPFASYLSLPNLEVASASPERFISLQNRNILSSPIKGTSANDKFLEKDEAENLMIVDLLRNDIGKVCETGTVHANHLFALESFANVHHLVSTVTGKLKSNMTAIDLLRACFPGGSITGAPKLRSMEIIEELEPNRRGIYCGAIGYIGFDGNMDTNIAIRTAIYSHQQMRFYAGGGIVADSECEKEYRETWDKASSMLQLVQHFGGDISLRDQVD